MSDKKGIADVLNAYKEKDESRNEFDWSKLTRNVCIILLAGTVCHKIIHFEIDKSIDLSTILSLALALFSIYISFLFYFKTTETSNRFYDNTYKFTKDISEMLVKIESGFGEKLDIIKERYVNGTHISNNIKNEIQEDITEKAKEQDKFIEDVLKRLNESEEEKRKLFEQYKEIESEKEDLRKSLERLRRQRNAELHNDRMLERYRLQRAVTDFAKNNIIPDISNEEYDSFDKKANRFVEIIKKGSFRYMRDLELVGFINEDRLTPRGLRWLQRLLEDSDEF